MDLNVIMNRPYPFNELSPNSLALFEKRGGGIVLQRVLQLLDKLTEGSPPPWSSSVILHFFLLLFFPYYPTFPLKSFFSNLEDDNDDDNKRDLKNELRTHHWTEALRKISQFLGIWRETYAALDHVMEDLGDFPGDGWLSTSYFSPAAAFENWLIQLEQDLVFYIKMN